MEIDEIDFIPRREKTKDAMHMRRRGKRQKGRGNTGHVPQLWASVVSKGTSSSTRRRLSLATVARTWAAIIHVCMQRLASFSFTFANKRISVCRARSENGAPTSQLWLVVNCHACMRWERGPVRFNYCNFHFWHDFLSSIAACFP